MYQSSSLRRALCAAAISASFVLPIAAQAGGHAPGGLQAAWAVKDPARFAPHLATANQPSHARGHTPSSGSFDAIMAVKDPQHYGPQLAYASACDKSSQVGLGVECRAWRISDVAAATLAQAGAALRPGSWDAIMSVKDPQHYGRKAGL